MKKILLLSFALCCVFPILHAQKFWLLTYEFPGGPKTGIAAAGDSCLVVGLFDGVLRSVNEGDHWDTVLEASGVYSVHATEDGVVLAGGAGKIFFSDDYGVLWDSVSLGHDYLVTGFLDVGPDKLFAITGNLGDIDFEGAGVYFSSDGGSQWTPRNTGLSPNLGCDWIAKDDNGRIYVTIREELNKSGGLFYSDNDGMQWHKVDISIDGMGVIEDEVVVYRTTGLSVSPEDSLYLSVEGVAGTVAIRLNLSKHIDDLQSAGYWNRRKIFDVVSWWLDRPLNGIHYAQNGDWYSSLSASISVGGTFFKKSGSAGWNRQTQGLGLDIFNNFSAQEFVEKSSGKIFMVQFLDERIYWADTSQVTSVGEVPIRENEELQVFPNPVVTGESFQVFCGEASGEREILLVGQYGNILDRRTFRGPVVELKAPENQGIFFLRCGGSTARVICAP